MNWLKILNDFETLVFQLTILVILAPKTFVRIAVNPRWLPAYLKAETQKDVAKRYDEYLSPIIYWIIFSVAVLTLRVLFIEYIANIIVGAIIGAFGDEVKKQSWTSFNLDTARFAQAIIISLCYPLAFATVPVLWVTKNVSKRTLELPFYLQCYAFGTFVTLCTALELLLVALGIGYFQIGTFPLNYVALAVCSVWMLWFQATFLRNESVTGVSIVAIFLLSAAAGTGLTYIAAKVILDLPNSLLN